MLALAPIAFPMMTRIPLATTVLLLTISASCSRKDSEDPLASAPASATAQALSFQIGDRVVGEVARAMFIEGQVESVGKSSLRLRVYGAGGSREVDAANVYRVGDAAAHKLKPGAFAVCEAKAHVWIGCRVERINENSLVATDDEGRELTVAPAQALAATAVTELNLKQSFGEASRRKLFVEGFKKAGPLHRPSKWKPRRNESVLVRSGAAFLEGRVSDVRKSLVLVELEGPEGERAVMAEDVHPQPPVDYQPAPGLYACVRPAQGDSVWPIVRIESVSESKAVVSDVHGQTRSVELRDLIPFHN